MLTVWNQSYTTVYLFHPTGNWQDDRPILLSLLFSFNLFSSWYCQQVSTRRPSYPVFFLSSCFLRHFTLVLTLFRAPKVKTRCHSDRCRCQVPPALADGKSPASISQLPLLPHRYIPDFLPVSLSLDASALPCLHTTEYSAHIAYCPPLASFKSSPSSHHHVIFPT